MKFTKMHGIGNDYVYVNCFEETVENPSELAKVVSDRHFGIGSDGLILILPSREADVRMRIYNADGSEAQMCGNGIRCVAKYAYEHGIAKKEVLAVETQCGIKTLQLYVADGHVSKVKVNMSKPRLLRSEIPMLVHDSRGGVAPPLQTTDEKCEKCGSPMVVRNSRMGKFLGCSGFPKCRNIKPLPTGVKCPKEGCGGELVQRKARKGKSSYLFYGCNNYPKCDYTVNKLPT